MSNNNNNVAPFAQQAGNFVGNGQKRPAEAPAENEPPQKKQKVEQQQAQAQPQQPQQPQHQYNEEPMDWE